MAGKYKCLTEGSARHFLWRRPDLNRRPSGYEPDELPTAPLRDLASAKIQLYY